VRTNYRERLNDNALIQLSSRVDDGTSIDHV
jgi:hypothetical protein